MASVFDVARYIVVKQNPITTMKLQKLVYYSQAWNLAWSEEPIFNEDFQAWANGPVCPDLFRYHHGKFVVDATFLQDVGNPDNLSDYQKDTIDKVLDFYGQKDPSWLSNLTHMERPWKESRNGVAPGEPSSNVISKEIMQQYYSGL